MRQMDRRQTLQLLAAAGGVSIAGESVTADSSNETKVNSAAAAQTTKLTASDGDTGDGFGYSVAIEGDKALVAAGGLHLGDDPDPNEGAAYVFERSGGNWSQRQKLGPVLNGVFSTSVAFDGDRALVSAPLQKEYGEVLLYEMSDGSLKIRTKFTPNDNPGPFPDFGDSVALDGDTVLVGTPEASNPNGDKSGAAYVFEQQQSGEWEPTKLAADDGEAGDEFGNYVALNGDTAFVGAPYDSSSNMFDVGSTYVFERSGGSWSQQAKLTAEDGQENALFGGSIALEGSTALIGAYTDDSADTASGSVYVFERSDGNWSQQAKLTATDGDQGDWFGFDVALEGTTALIGARLDDDPTGQDAGSAYTFEKSDGGWSQQTKLSADDGDNNDRFGGSVALSGDTTLIGAPTDEDPHGDRAGSAYVFDLSGESGGDGPPPIGGQDPPRDPDGDGLYEDVDGDGDFTIGDVQVFFQNRNSDVVQDNAEFFNFSGGEPDEVTIADVQGLFQEWSNTDE